MPRGGFTCCKIALGWIVSTSLDKKPHNCLAAEMSPFRIQVFWCEDFVRCWNSIVFLSLRSLNHLFLDLNQEVSLLARSSLEVFSLLGENTEPQMAAGAGAGSTGAAFVVNLASRLHHVRLAISMLWECFHCCLYLLFMCQVREIFMQPVKLLEVLGITILFP